MYQKSRGKASRCSHENFQNGHEESSMTQWNASINTPIYLHVEAFEVQCLACYLTIILPIGDEELDKDLLKIKQLDKPHMS